MAKVITKEILCVVFGSYDSTGERAMEVFRVRLSQDDYDNGEHYDSLRTLVTDRGKYEDRYSDSDIVVFDENDARSVGFVFPEEAVSSASLIAI